MDQQGTTWCSWSGSRLIINSRIGLAESQVMRGFLAWNGSGGQYGREEVEGTVGSDLIPSLRGTRLIPPTRSIVLAFYNGQSLFDGDWGTGVPGDFEASRGGFQALSYNVYLASADGPNSERVTQQRQGNDEVKALKSFTSTYANRPYFGGGSPTRYLHWSSLRPRPTKSPSTSYDGCSWTSEVPRSSRWPTSKWGSIRWRWGRR